MTMLSPAHSAAADAFFRTGFEAAPIMGIFRGLGADETLRRSRAAWATGVRLVEVPVQSEESWSALEAVVAQAAGRPVGSGTVLTREQVERTARAGGAFCVSPGLDPEIGRACEEVGLFHLPGVATATEVATAVAAGYRWLKAFPASVLGSEWVRAMRGPFPDVAFVCTGGMTQDSWPEYSAAGASALAIGAGWS